MYIENPEEEQNKQQSSSSPAVGAGGGGAAVSTGGGTSTGGNPSTVSPIQTNQPMQSFANVQDYLKANQPQGENFGNQFVSTVGQGVGQAQSAIDTSAQNAQNEISGGTVKSNLDLLNQVGTNPTGITGDAGKLAEFQKEYNAQYTGPSSFESSDQYGTAANAANKAAQTGQELGTTGGREQLLQDVFDVYGQGNKGLDQTLLQNSSAYPNVAPLAQSFQSVQDYLKAASGNVANSVGQAQQTTQNTATQAQNAPQQAEKNFEANMAANVGQAQTNAANQYQALQQDLAGAKGPEQVATTLQKYGFTPEQAAVLGNIQTKDTGFTPPQTPISSYITAANPAMFTPYNTASLQDYLNSAALGRLNNNQSPYLPSVYQGQANTPPQPAIDKQQLAQSYLPAVNDAINYWTNYAQSHPNAGIENLISQYQNYKTVLQGIS